MGEAILASLIAAVGRSNVRVSDGRADHGREIANKYQVTWGRTNVETVEGCDVVVIAVKPQDIEPLAQQVAPHLKEGTVVVSVAAGVSTEQLREQFGPRIHPVRVM